MYKKAQILEFLEQIKSGEISIYNLPKDLYFEISELLEKEMYRGFGKTLTELTPGTEKYIALQTLKNNAYKFSGAKVFQQVRALEKLTKKADYLEKGEKLFRQHNKSWLDVERQLAQRSARAVKNWEDIQEIKDVKPLLKYQTAGDERVRGDHAALDNIVKPVDDGFWDSYFPPWDYNCRCITISVSDEPVTKVSKKLSKPTSFFKEHIGKDKFALKKHPYYKVPKTFKELKKRNFDLPLPK